MTKCKHCGSDNVRTTILYNCLDCKKDTFWTSWYDSIKGILK